MWCARLAIARSSTSTVIWLMRVLAVTLSMVFENVNAEYENLELTFGVIDHDPSTLPGRNATTYEPSRERIGAMQENCREFRLRLFDVNDPGQGIVHVIATEHGIVLPGMTVVCGDSHTATSGGVGAWGWGIGTTEVERVFATQTLLLPKPKTMRANFLGRVSDGVSPKDLILYLIGQYGVAIGTGYAVEYAGPAIRALPVEGRLTICNMSIEFGARSGMIAPDDVTIQFFDGRPYAPTGALWDQAVAYWRRCRLPTRRCSTGRLISTVRRLAHRSPGVPRHRK